MRFDILQGYAAQLLGWRPDEFWRATPTELIASINQPAGQTAVCSPNDLQTLMKRFPDGPSTPLESNARPVQN